MWIQVIFSIFGIIIFVGASIVSMKIYQKQKKMDITPNMPLCENPSRTQFTQGYYMGVEKSCLKRKNGTYRVEFYPIDIEQGESKPLPNVQTMIVGRGMRKIYPRGELSSRREVVKYISPNPLDMPDKMIKSQEGKELTNEAYKQHFTTVFGESVKAGFEAMGEEMKEYAMGQIPKATLSQMKESNKKLLELQALKEIEKEKSENKQ